MINISHGSRHFGSANNLWHVKLVFWCGDFDVRICLSTFPSVSDK